MFNILSWVGSVIIQDYGASYRIHIDRIGAGIDVG